MSLLISFIAQYLVFAVVLIAIIAVLLSPSPIRISILKLVVLSSLIAYLFAFVAGIFYYDPRPFVVEHIQPLFPYSADNGFPSEHTLFATVIAGAIFIYRRKLGIFLGAMGILIGVARVAAAVHHPIDIIGGIAIAVIATYISWTILKFADKSFRRYP